MDYERPLADGGGADGDARKRVFAVRNVEDALRAEALERPARGAEDAAEVVDADAGQEDARVGLHALHGGLVDRFPVLQRAHQYVPSIRCSRLGKGAALAATTAASISSCAS